MSLTPSLELSARRPLGMGSAALAGFVILVVALMIVPLPTALLDLLLASNLALSVTILLVSLQVSHALKIAAFPTILLLTTLLRLALNVSSTRLIMLQADAGEVIRAFGQFVVRGNYVVGAVIFLILTIIQFVVIAKGSERVAEVGARFTLDAMPGKQMAIDAELRAGSIDGREAQRRRELLSRESQFYGAMDGAMKFVKGDVVASFLITLINIIGGLAIGVGQRGMDGVTALKRYGLLTIGDGLVNQIPALILATAAGVLVTRVASEEPGTSLGDEIFSEMFGQPRALRAAGVFVLLLAVVPGLPLLPFLVIGSLLLAVAYAGLGRGVRASERTAKLAPRPAPAGYVPGIEPWSLTFGADLAALLQGAREPDKSGSLGLTRTLEARLFAELGVPLPTSRIYTRSELAPREVVLELREMEALRFTVPTESSDGALFVVEQVLPVLRAHAADFLGIAETQRLLTELEKHDPGTVPLVVPKAVSVVVLAEVLRHLVCEGISVRDLKGILEALVSMAPAEKDPAALAEFVRAAQKRTITHTLTAGRGDIEVYLLNPAVEDVVRGAITRAGDKSYLALAPAAGRDILRAVERALNESPPSPGHAKVLLTEPDIRRFIRKLVELDLPDLVVLSHAELEPRIGVKALARISPS